MFVLTGQIEEDMVLPPSPTQESQAQSKQKLMTVIPHCFECYCYSVSLSNQY